MNVLKKKILLNVSICFVLFTNLISQGIISINYKFNSFFIARKISFHFTTRRNPQIILLRIIRVVPEKHEIISPLCCLFYFILIQIRSFRLLCTIFKQFIYFDFIITIYSIYSVNSTYSAVILFKHLLYNSFQLFSQLNLK